MFLTQRIFFMEHLFPIGLVFIPGVWSGNWGVTVQSQCALRGSTVVIQCSYDYPIWHTVRRTGWFKGRWVTGSGYALDSLPRPRFEYVGDKNHNCALKIKNIQSIDEGSYFFLFETNFDNWRSKNPPYLSVEDLIASVSSTVVAEGEVVTLTCQSGCNTNSNFQVVWYKERQAVRQTHFTARREDAGSYTCALQGQEHIRSSVSLNVLYAPKNVKLSISQPADIIQGRTVILTCSSEANPIVTSSGYSLYKDGNFISFGSSHKISEVQPSDSGQYYCQAWNNISRTGSNVFQSSKTSVNVLYPPINISISAELTEVTEGSDVNLTCHSMANPPASGFIWYRTSSSSVVQVGSGPVMSLSPVEASSSGLYMCQASNRLGENNSTQLQLSVKSKYAVTSFPILVGTGVSLLIAFVLALLLYWKIQKRNQKKSCNIKSQSQQTTGLSERESSSSAVEDHIYVNALMFQTPSSNANYSSSEEVFYTTVTMQPRKSNRRSYMKTTPEVDSVIYAAVETKKPCPQ